MPLPVFFRWEMDLQTNVLTKIDQLLYVYTDSSFKLFDIGEPIPEGWRLMTDEEWDILFPPEEPPVDPEPQD